METSVEQLVSAARSGGPLGLRAAARLMSVMTDEPQRLAELLAGSRDWPQPRLVLGITGAPGSGKSTLTDHLAIDYRLRYPDRRLGIVAVDPSSPFTGGALLGDRVRMMRHSTDPQVFIRSLASRGHLGGLALGAKGVVRVMGLIGCDVVIVETVGVGQSEVEIAKNADMVIVVLAPGQGDSVQMLKAGLMEAGDMFVINKADRPEAAQLQQQLLATLQTSSMAQLDLTPVSKAMACHGDGKSVFNNSSPSSSSAARSKDGRGGGLNVPPVLLTSATNHEGISALVDELECVTVRNSEHWRKEREQQALEEIRQAVLEEVRQRVCTVIGTNGASRKHTQPILEGSITLDKLVDKLLREAVARQGCER
jgi:LAO/AO transport system kinase